MRLTDLAPVAVLFVIAGIALSIGAEVTQDVRDAMTSGSHAWLAAENATIGISRLAKWLPTIALVCAAAIIIGVVFSSFVAGRA